MDTDAKSKRRKFLRGYLRIFPATTALLLAALTILPVQAQEKAIVALTAQQVMPGNQAYVTVMLTNNPAMDVSQLHQWIEFPKDKLSYVSSRMSIAGDLAEAELKVEVTDKADAAAPEGAGADTPEAGRESTEAGGQTPEAPPKDPGEAPAETAAPAAPGTPGLEAGTQTGNIGVIHLTIIGKRPIPDGPVAEITFKVPETVEEQIIQLLHRAEAKAPDGETLSEFAASDGELIVSRETPERPPAIFSCFFYMH